MRLRTFVLLSIAVTVVAGNTALLVWRKGRKARAPIATLRGASVEPPREMRVAPRPPTAEETALAVAEADRPALRVLVLDAKGAPVAGARVVAEGDRRGRGGPFREFPFAEGMTGADGACDLRLARRARTRVVASKEGFAEVEQQFVGPEVVFRLPREGIVRGRVVEDAGGLPVSDARVVILRSGFPNFTTTTGADGAFTVRGLSQGHLSVEVTHDLHPRVEQFADVVEGGECALEIRLRRGFTLRGRVTYVGSDRKVTEGTIASLGSSSHGTEAVTTRAAPLDGEGRFLLRGLDGPSRYFRIVTGTSVYRAQGQRPEIDPATGEQVGEILVSLPANNPPGLEFQGVVRDEEGRPVAGARVLAGNNVVERAAKRTLPGASDDWNQETLTDAGGAYRIAVEYGGDQVLALHPDYAPTLLVLPARSRNRANDLVLARGATLHVAVRDAAGRPAADAEVYAVLRHPEPRWAHLRIGNVHEGLRARSVTDARGLAALPRIGQGSWYVVARALHLPEGARVALEIDAGAKDTAVDIAMKALPSVSGRVVDGSGNPVAGAWVMAVEDDIGGDRPSATSGADGTFTIPAVLAHPSWDAYGGVPLNANSRTAGSTRDSVIVPYGGEADLEVVQGAGPWLR